MSPAAVHHVRVQQRQEVSDMKISVIIPVLGEEKSINKILDSIKSVSADTPYETIVVDGDSSGSTITRIADSSILKMTAPRGRALQMNAGAAIASGDILLFLHADTLLPPQAFPKIIAAVFDKHFIGGAFDLKLENRKWIFRAIGCAASLKHRLTRVPYGDQAIFILKSYFEKIGGYPAIPLMEDVELMKRVKQSGGRIKILRETVITSSRKWEADGIIYTVTRNWIIQALYLFGVPADKLEKYYYPAES